MIRQVFFSFLYIISNIVWGQLSYYASTRLNMWIFTNISHSESVKQVLESLNIDQQIWLGLFALYFPFSKDLLSRSLIDSDKMNYIIGANLFGLFTIYFIALYVY
jgi:hypothetical protein